MTTFLTSFVIRSISRFLGLLLLGGVISAGTAVYRHVSHAPPRVNHCATTVAWWNASVDRSNTATDLFNDELTFTGSKKSRSTAVAVHATISSLEATQVAAPVPTLGVHLQDQILEEYDATLGYVELAAEGDEPDIDAMNDELAGMYDDLEAERRGIADLCN